MIRNRNFNYFQNTHLYQLVYSKSDKKEVGFRKEENVDLKISAVCSQLILERMG